MKLSLLVPLFASLLAACASATPPPKSVETTGAITPSREAFTPPDELQMTIADRPEAEPPQHETVAPAMQPESPTAKKSGMLVTLPHKSTPDADAK